MPRLFLIVLAIVYFLLLKVISLFNNFSLRKEYYENGTLKEKEIKFNNK